jgi:cytochrome c556
MLLRTLLWTFALAALGGLVAGGAAVKAQDQKATGVVAVRQATMKANGDHVTAIKTILTEYPQLQDQIPFHAMAIEQALGHVPALFPPGSDQQPTYALPTIWQDQAGFRAAADKAAGLAGKLLDTAKGGDQKATLAAFAALGKEGCSGCHQNFRKNN